MDNRREQNAENQQDVTESGSSICSSGIRNYAIDTEQPGVDPINTAILLVNLILEDEVCDFRIKLGDKCGIAREGDGRRYIHLISVTGQSIDPYDRISRRVGDGLPTIVCVEDGSEPDKSKPFWWLGPDGNILPGLKQEFAGIFDLKGVFSDINRAREELNLSQ